MRQYEPHAKKPVLHLSIDEIRTVDAIIRGYLSYMHGNVMPSPEQETDLALLKALRGRIAAMISDGGKSLSLTAQEIQVLADAMLGFVKATTRVVAQSLERDETLAPILSIRQHLLRMLSATYN